MAYDIGAMRRLSADIRIETIRALANAGYGHIGGAMSICDLLGVLYGGVMRVRPEEPDWPERDWFVLSKGHCGPALYAALALKGYYPMEALRSINRGGTMLPSHCDRLKTPGIDMTTGSLGQGMSSALGIACGGKLKGLPGYTYCVLGDGECQEGQVWEGAELATQLALDRFVVFIDDNKKQLDGPVKGIRAHADLAGKFRAFGWHVQTCRGYDAEDIARAIECAKALRGAPSLIVLDTFKGLGCLDAERAAFNHYMVIDQAMAERAIDEIERRYADGSYPRGDVRW